MNSTTISGSLVISSGTTLLLLVSQLQILTASLLVVVDDSSICPDLLLPPSVQFLCKEQIGESWGYRFRNEAHTYCIFGRSRATSWFPSLAKSDLPTVGSCSSDETVVDGYSFFEQNNNLIVSIKRPN